MKESKVCLASNKNIFDCICAHFVCSVLSIENLFWASWAGLGWVQQFDFFYQLNFFSQHQPYVLSLTKWTISQELQCIVGKVISGSMTKFQFCFWNYSIWINKSWQIISSREVESLEQGPETGLRTQDTEYNVQTSEGFRLLSSECCWSELSFVKCHSGRSWSPRRLLSNVLSAEEKKSPFSNIFWEINVARESPQDRKNILYGSTIALNCILERLLSRENCFLVRHLNRKLKTPGALLRRTNIKLQTVCEHCFREDLPNLEDRGRKKSMRLKVLAAQVVRK